MGFSFECGVGEMVKERAVVDAETQFFLDHYRGNEKTLIDLIEIHGNTIWFYWTTEEDFARGENRYNASFHCKTKLEVVERIAELMAYDRFSESMFCG